MIGLVSVSVLAIVAVEYFMRLPLVAHARAISETVRKATRTVTSRNVSDHWKEIALLRYSRDMARETLILFLMIAGCAALVGGPAYVLDRLLAPSPSVIGTLSDPLGLAAMTLVSIVYFALRKAVVGR